jgi:hypothetical protein
VLTPAEEGGYVGFNPETGTTTESGNSCTTYLYIERTALGYTHWLQSSSAWASTVFTASS